MDFSSRLLENAVHEISRLPGIGKRTALRMALYLLKQPEKTTTSIIKSLEEFRFNIILCQNCHNLSDTKICEICSNPRRDSSQICVVEDIRDVIAIENTNQYKGVYHVLNGIISPIDGIGPQDLFISSLIGKIKEGNIKEVIFAISPTMEGDTTIFYIYKKLKPYKVLISSIARGIPIGDELEYTDEVTLGRSILKRIPYEG
ncbi:MAG: recombination mediator RecR [Flavobacteriaceae bacterium]|nr:recombination mediator RecR [Flavobacteriaceae bacterium]